jgi:hypothetical protein
MPANYPGGGLPTNVLYARAASPAVRPTFFTPAPHRLPLAPLCQISSPKMIGAGEIENQSVSVTL